MSIAANRAPNAGRDSAGHLGAGRRRVSDRALLFRAEVAAAVTVWIESTAYNHCFLVVPVIGVLLWRRRAELARLQADARLDRRAVAAVVRRRLVGRRARGADGAAAARRRLRRPKRRCCSCSAGAVSRPSGSSLPISSSRFRSVPSCTRRCKAGPRPSSASGWTCCRFRTGPTVSPSTLQKAGSSSKKPARGCAS